MLQLLFNVTVLLLNSVTFQRGINLFLQTDGAQHVNSSGVWLRYVSYSRTLQWVETQGPPFLS